MIWYFMQSAALLIILYFIPWFGILQDEARLVVAGGAAIILSGISLFLFEILRAPSEIWEKDQETIKKLIIKVSPCIEVEFDNISGMTLVPIGTVVGTHGGTFVTNTKGHNTVLRVKCQNISGIAIVMTIRR